MLMRLIPLAAASESSQQMLDYWRFHGMLVGPAAARRCVKSFDGVILFMPSTYDPAAFQAEDAAQNVSLPFEVRTLTLLKYYALVLWSLTGLCTLLRQTRTLDAAGEDDEKPLLPTPLAVHRNVVECLRARTGASRVTLARRFEFRFRLIGLWVAMHHYRSASGGEGRLHLVEVYQFDRRVCAAWACAIAALAIPQLWRVLLLLGVT